MKLFRFFGVVSAALAQSDDLVSSEIDENIKKQKEVKSLEVEYKHSVLIA